MDDDKRTMEALFHVSQFCLLNTIGYLSGIHADLVDGNFLNSKSKLNEVRESLSRLEHILDCMNETEDYEDEEDLIEDEYDDIDDVDIDDEYIDDEEELDDDSKCASSSDNGEKEEE